MSEQTTVPTRKVRASSKIIVPIKDCLKHLYDYNTKNVEDIVSVLEDDLKLTVDEAEATAEALINLGYMTSDGEFTDKGAHYNEVLNRPYPSMIVDREKGERPNYPVNVLRLIRGFPGAGKTELGKIIAEGLRASGLTVAHLEADQFMHRDNRRFDSNRVYECALECHAQADYNLREGNEVIVSNVFTKYWEIEPYFKSAGLGSFKTQLIEVQGQWNSNTRTPETKNSIVDNWGKIELPFRWKEWLHRRAKQQRWDRRPKVEEVNNEPVSGTEPSVEEGSKQED
jgi:hypothetical protein